jgi:NADPH:quinone reductase-like Zn-dependent oxidoreductase
MRALTITDDSELRVEERPDPAPGPGEVLVRVHGAGLNRADLVQLAGFYAAPPGSPPDIPGLEFGGVVAALGPGVERPAVGERVFGIAGGGGQAELVAVPAEHCATVPASLDLVTAGGVPEVFVTAHDAMVTQAAIATGETMLVHAVGSGVGTAAVQLAKAMGCTVVGTALTVDKL